MRLICLAALLCFLPALAFAQPGYFRVTGVALDDTLNVRAEPRASSADIGDLPPDATGVEVQGTDASGKWGRIIWQEGMGWISMRFLEPDPVPRLADTQLPAGMLCGGTEPFWSVQFSANTAIYSDIEGTVHSMALQNTMVAGGRPNFPVYTGFAGSDAQASMIFEPSQCSDGMSDRDYPWQIELLIGTATGGRFLVGCCNLPLEVGSH